MHGSLTVRELIQRARKLKGPEPKPTIPLETEASIQKLWKTYLNDPGQLETDFREAYNPWGKAACLFSLLYPGAREGLESKDYRQFRNSIYFAKDVIRRQNPAFNKPYPTNLNLKRIQLELPWD